MRKARSRVKMAILYRYIRQFGKSLMISEPNRNISLSAIARLKESEFVTLLNTTCQIGNAT